MSIAQNSTQDQNFEQEINDKGIENLIRLFGLGNVIHGSQYGMPSYPRLPVYSQRDIKQYLIEHLSQVRYIATNSRRKERWTSRDGLQKEYFVKASYIDLDIYEVENRSLIISFVEYMRSEYNIAVNFGQSRNGATRLFVVYKRELPQSKAYRVASLVATKAFEFFKNTPDKNGNKLKLSDIKFTPSSPSGAGVVVSLPARFISNGSESVTISIGTVNELSKFLMKNQTSYDDIKFPENTVEIKNINKKQFNKKTKTSTNKSFITVFNRNISKVFKKRNTSTKEIVLQQVVELVKPHYVKGSRNNIIFYLSGYAYHLGISLDTAQEIISELIENDEERTSRIAVVKHTYKRALDNKPVKFREFFAKYFKDEDAIEIVPFFELVATVVETARELLGDKKGAHYALLNLTEMVYKRIRFGKVLVSLPAMQERYGVHRRDIVTGNRLLEEAGIVKCVSKSSKKGTGSEYEILILNDEVFSGAKKAETISDIFKSEIIEKVDFTAVLERVRATKQKYYCFVKHFVKTKHLDRKSNIIYVDVGNETVMTQNIPEHVNTKFKVKKETQIIKRENDF